LDQGTDWTPVFVELEQSVQSETLP
jgi:hypothetical protein